MTKFVTPFAHTSSWIGRARGTGKYHMARGATTHCNYSGQRRSIVCVPATLAECEKASEAMWCKKCFGKKPETFTTFEA